MALDYLIIDSGVKFIVDSHVKFDDGVKYSVR